MTINPGDVLRIVLIISGVYTLIKTIGSLSKRKMTESFCLVWGIVSVAIILAGILLRPSHWSDYISVTGLILVLIIFYCVLYAAYFVSIKISELMRKNQELAIQVSMLNQENERILSRLQEITGIDIRDI